MLVVFSGSNLDQPQTAPWNEPSPLMPHEVCAGNHREGGCSPSADMVRRIKCSVIREISDLAIATSPKDFTFPFIQNPFFKKKMTQILTHLRLPRQRGTAAWLYLHLCRCPVLLSHAHHCVQTPPFTPRSWHLHVIRG